MTRCSCVGLERPTISTVRRVIVAPLLWAARLSGQRELIAADLEHWMSAEQRDRIAVMSQRVWRTQLLYRLRQGRRLPYLLARIWCIPLGFERTLILDCPDIGPGLHMHHGFATIVVAHKIGAQCRINQQVTVGWSKGDYPTIGDNVEIKAGAKVLGGITIGDRVRIGANAVVLKDVPNDMTVVGVPSHHYGAHKEWIETSLKAPQGR